MADLIDKGVVYGHQEIYGPGINDRDQTGKQLADYLQTLRKTQTPMTKTINNQIAVEPFKATSSVKSVKRGGLTVIEQTVNLVKVKVVHAYQDDHLTLKAGDWVYLNGNSGATPWAKASYVFGDQTFCLVPKQEIVMVETA